MKNPIAPVVTTERDQQIAKHPAFGSVALSVISIGGGAERREPVFGSKVENHMSMIRITVSTANMMTSSTGSEHLYPQEALVEFDMTHQQFAEFITSNGRFEGVPITLRHVTQGKLVVLPGIAPGLDGLEKIRREIKEHVGRDLNKVEEGMDALRKAIESGGKKAIKEALFCLETHIGNLPGNLDFHARRADETIERRISAAKVEIESFIGTKAKSLGLESIEALGNHPKTVEHRIDGAAGRSESNRTSIEDLQERLRVMEEEQRKIHHGILSSGFEMHEVNGAYRLVKATEMRPLTDGEPRAD